MESTIAGTSAIMVADDDVQDLIQKIKGAAEKKTGKKFSKFKAVSYKKQLVCGTNYFVKIAVDDDKYIHVRIFCALPHMKLAPELEDFQLDKTKDGALEYF